MRAMHLDVGRIGRSAAWWGIVGPLAAAFALVSPVAVPPRAAAAGSPATTGHRIVGYFAEWADDRGYHVADIPADKLTNVNYAFAVIRDGQCAARGKSAPEQ